MTADGSTQPLWDGVLHGYGENSKFDYLCTWIPNRRHAGEDLAALVVE